ncbi:putative oxidoreductase [Frondihabitans sucicola]|uniref:Oxidoreductase n=1 Tax=Frondihabitans sucicola TaxID=1268041 RepID=A0ABN6Y2G9_9MICO|nr:molybdopterin-dependent oxidoreductase [Frondihabitans sucicola]BDZ50282.1 putative oxidoreductase [Frondihabitans sucicola]
MTLRHAPAAESGRAAAPSDAPGARAARILAGASGLVALAGFLAGAEVVAVFVGAGSSPLVGVGSAVIDLAPPGAKTTMVGLFGTGDKLALFALMGILLVVIAAAAGLLERSRAPWGRSIFGVGTLLAVIAVRTRADATDFDMVPSVVGGVVAVVLLHALIGRLFRWQAAAANAAAEARGDEVVQLTPPLRQTPVERRAFLRLGLVSAAASVVLGAGARVINASAVNAAALRGAVRLPRAAVKAPAIPAGSSLRIAGLAPYVTPNADFYRIDTALSVPQVDPTTWKLEITGLVDTPLTLTWKELLDLPLVEHLATLSCVSNDVGGDLIGNALWLGYPLRSLLAKVGVHQDADMVLSRSIDGFTASTPLSVLQDPGTQALLAIGMNGEPLPIEHGFPVRMVVPGLYGYVSATKWVTSLHVTRFADEKAYWTTRGYTARGPVKLESRIDTPSPGSTVAPGNDGTVPLAGVAWEPHTGIASVHVRIDSGQWREATLANSVSDDTWRQWVYRWPVTSGTHRVQVRATSKDGTTQPAKYVSPAPNGAEGWDEISVTVRR